MTECKSLEVANCLNFFVYITKFKKNILLTDKKNANGISKTNEDEIKIFNKMQETDTNKNIKRFILIDKPIR